MLADLDLLGDYRSGRDALLNDFYIPCLGESLHYDRAVGYFSSSLLQVLAIAYSGFIGRGGHMRLICSPALRAADFDAMKQGVHPATRAQDLVREELEILLSRPESIPATRLLATLVSANVLEVQIAFLDHSPGIFHDKLGIFQDSDGRRVSFVGSANETWAAWGLNHESFEVFCSWRGEAELLRTRRHADHFDRLWSGLEPGVNVDPIDRVTRDRLIEVADDDVERAMAQVRARPHSLKEERKLLPYQVAVLDSWRKNRNRGIVAFATGAGKTLVALTAVKEWTATGRPALIIVPGKDLHHQWLSEIPRVLPTSTPLLCGAGFSSAKWGDLLNAYTSDAQVGQSPRVVLTTNATFASRDFQARLKSGPHLLVIGDEVHRLGARRNLAALKQTEAGATMGLSATYSRKFDEPGTADLVEWFGEVLEPVIGIAEAILMGRLVPYDYFFYTLQLDDDELEKYMELTKKISRVAAGEVSSSEPSEYLRMLLIERARLMKQARGKVGAALDILSNEFRPNERWLVYCDDLTQLNAVVAGGLSRSLPMMEFHSYMRGDRASVLHSLDLYGGIVVAIRCLDEGVDIPVCDNALILASSTVDREYIQRRGRVLRVAEGKFSARIHDLLLVNEHGGVLARSEALRALEFARVARNPGARAHLRLRIALSPDVQHLPGLTLEEDEDEVVQEGDV